MVLNNSDILKLLNIILDNAQAIRIMQVQLLADDMSKYKQEYTQSNDAAWKRLNDAHKQLCEYFEIQEKYDISDAFVLSQHNKIHAVLPNGAHLVLERILNDFKGLQQYFYVLGLKDDASTHYWSTDFTKWDALVDAMIPFQIGPQDKIWTSIER